MINYEAHINSQSDGPTTYNFIEELKKKINFKPILTFEILLNREFNSLQSGN